MSWTKYMYFIITFPPKVEPKFSTLQNNCHFKQ